MHTIAPLIPNIDSSRRWVVSLTPRSLCPSVKTSCTYWIGSWGNTRAGPVALQKRKIIWSCQGSNSVPPTSSLVTILTELEYSTVFSDIMISGPHVTFQKLRLLQECKGGLQNTDGTIINGSVSYPDSYEGSVGNHFRCSLRANHRSNSVVNLYVSVISATKGIIFKICFTFQTDTFGFINTCTLTEQVLKQDHSLLVFGFVGMFMSVLMVI
jgi:hypothetical protein